MPGDPDASSRRRATAGGSAVLDEDALLDVVRDAVAVVCQVNRDRLTGTTTFAELQADSLVRVGVADVVEDSVARRWSRPVSLDDAALGRAQRLADVAAHVRDRLSR